MRKSTLFLLTLFLLAAGCRGGEKPGQQQAGEAPTSPSPTQPPVCPLTGKPAPSGADLDRPALSVKIENASQARPQAGLAEADIVYEQLAEGGITRFNAIYHCSDAEQLGPVRSARFVDADILVEYVGNGGDGRDSPGVLFAYAGAAPPVEDKIRSTQGITDLSRSSKAYRRDRSRKAPHNLFSSTEQLRSQPDAADVAGPPATGLEFQEPEASPSAAPASAPTQQQAPGAASLGTADGSGNEISFSFGGRTPSRYTFDAASASYLRFHGNEPHRTVGGDQLSATNVVVMKVQVRPGTIRDAAGNPSPEIAVIGSGEAVVLFGGKAVIGKWDRSNLSQKTRLTDASGSAVKLKPGETWFHLVPASQAVTVK